jgi:dynactin complex subunit
MDLEVGERLVIAKHRATVRYIGPVEGQEGTWVGVEWDDPSRGKHDGTTGGKRYFICSCDSPAAASFVRISKISRGSSLVDALVLRYTNQLAEGQAAADGQVFLHTSSHRKVWVELVGEQKVTERLSKTELLQAARLVGANASHVVSELGGGGVSLHRGLQHHHSQ